ncbi:hypothetical protein RB623_23065 [Mesorhizobium sp. LHD-90]|uniref:hypothetical protein n=1 Tax=Mesorhizobium sp. LHD-90 TaxID=3071414 RepID=UPI0027E05CC2|nr:hypothetical protein [Mesorhizobium sp. LHD-90]MDQ6436942.1 hypothetical protein [Mesorhizobium sp. LHD-90]
MEFVTLIHTRWPKDEFIYDHGAKGEIVDDVDNLSADDRGRLYRTARQPLNMPANRKRYSGLWGTMMMVIGGPIHCAQFDQPVPADMLCGGRQVEFTINSRKVFVATFGDVLSTKLFTTVERYRTDDGRVDIWDIGFVRLMRRDKPYGLRVERNNSAVKELRPGHDGICLRVLGGSSLQQQAILIHEAPNVGWVTGCIGPRPHGNREVFENKTGNPSDLAVREIIREVDRRGGKGQFYVLRG